MADPLALGVRGCEDWSCVTIGALNAFAETEIPHPAPQTAGDAPNPLGVNHTAPAAHLAQSRPVARPSAPLRYSKCYAVLMNTRGSLRIIHQRGSL